MALDLASVVAGAKYPGRVRGRLKAVVDEITESSGQLIIVHGRAHTSSARGRRGVDGRLEHAQAGAGAGDLRMIGATTIDEYRKHIEKDAALERRFQRVLVDEPTVDVAIEILTGLKDRYEAFHRVR